MYKDFNLHRENGSGLGYASGGVLNIDEDTTSQLNTLYIH